MTTTTTATVTVTTVAHDDTTVRTVTYTRYGHTVTVADSPDHGRMFCADCNHDVTPVVAVTVLNNEEWTYDSSADDTLILCGECYNEDVFADEAEAAEYAADADADRRYHERKDEGR
jgi:RNase P subunit RPR2